VLGKNKKKYDSNSHSDKIFLCTYLRIVTQFIPLTDTASAWLVTSFAFTISHWRTIAGASVLDNEWSSINWLVSDPTVALLWTWIYCTTKKNTAVNNNVLRISALWCCIRKECLSIQILFFIHVHWLSLAAR